jgi:hypothetical protein
MTSSSLVPGSLLVLFVIILVVQLSRVSRRRASAPRDPDSGPICFRISQIPKDWEEEFVLQTVLRIDPELRPEDMELSLFPSCCDPTQKTALLNLKRNTKYFRSFKKNGEKTQEFIGENLKKIVLVLDKHFYDLTPMNSPQKPIIAEFVPVINISVCNIC